MKKYNKGKALPVERRLEIYTRLLEVHEKCEYRYEGFCFTARPILEEEFETHTPVYIDEHPYLLPELHKFRTYRTWLQSAKDDNAGYWYRDNEERIEALKKAIELLTTK